jgi:23S rRNA (guanosine2251-2'-O)-methyltransferase
MFQSSKQFIAGRNPVLEALKAGSSIDKILLFKNATGINISEIKALAQQNKVPVQFVPLEKLNSITNVQHQGVLAYKSSVAYLDLQTIIDHVNSEGKVPLFLMLDGVTDVRNIGAIVRTAVCYGVQCLIIPDKGVGALNEDAMKASAGALEKINVCRVQSLLKAVDELRLNGISVVVSEMKAEKDIANCDLKQPVTIIMGAEGKGVQPFMLKAADEKFKIPMTGEFDSLNVSVATGIILYESMRQRNLQPAPRS